MKRITSLAILFLSVLMCLSCFGQDAPIVVTGSMPGWSELFAHAQNGGGTLPSIEHQKEFQQQLQILQEAQRAVQLKFTEWCFQVAEKTCPVLELHEVAHG